jgi:CRP/FNR family cyclic AMP-dependent transcriptional regulator
MDSQLAETLTTGWLRLGEPAVRDAFLKAGRIRRFADGARVYDFEQEQTCIWGVTHGVIRISVTMNEQDAKLAHCGGPGFWFGETAVILGLGRSVQAVASGETRLCAIERSDIVELAREAPEVWRMVGVLCGMNQLIAIGAGDDLMIRDPRKRLVAVLLRLSGHRNAFQGTPPIAAVPLTHVELADAAALSRSKTAEILRELGERGVIKAEYGAIRIVEPASLKGLLARKD